MSESPPIDLPREETQARASAAPPTPDHPADKDTWRGYFLFLAQRVFVYFSLYALSIGPLYWKWYEAQFVGGSAILAAFYLPLVTLAEWVPPFGEWVNWYIRLWIAW